MTRGQPKRRGMEKELARYVVNVAIRSSTHLTSLLPLLKEHCGSEEYKTYAIAIAAAIEGINSEVSELVFSRFPEMRQEIDEEIRKYGLVL